MKILYIGYWGANEGLSQASINPHLEILIEFSEVSEITYVSIEREPATKFRIPISKKLVHYPLFPSVTHIPFLDKLYLFVHLANTLIKKVKTERFDIVICRSSLAGVFGLKIFNSLDIPFIVESFEPHSQYMLEAGIWKRFGISYNLQRYWERNQAICAKAIITVTNNYRQLLISKGINKDKVKVNPCCVNDQLFQFSIEDRQSIRNKHAFGKDDVVGIYVGKFGGLYLDLDAANRIFNYFSEKIPRFRLIILSPQSDEINLFMESNSKIQRSITCINVSHENVPKYLSASDFAFSLHSPTPSKLFVSPIKNGEYWASGLPILMFDGIGDDSVLVRNNIDLGHIIENENTIGLVVENLIKGMKKQSRKSLHSITGRDFQVVRDTYRELLLS